MEIINPTFIKSSAKVSECPESNLPEFAFIGRSNVGKSSLINMLTGRKKLAKISVTPGKTKLINHFLIDEKWYMVDLPGYGYAKVSKKDRRKFGIIIEKYIEKRENLICLFVLIDSSIKPQQIDLDFIQWLGINEIPFVLIFTKTDKANQKTRKVNFRQFQTEMRETWEELPPTFFTSSKNRTGRDEILKFIYKHVNLS